MLTPTIHPMSDNNYNDMIETATAVAAAAAAATVASVSQHNPMNTIPGIYIFIQSLTMASIQQSVETELPRVPGIDVSTLSEDIFPKRSIVLLQLLQNLFSQKDYHRCITYCKQFIESSLITNQYSVLAKVYYINGLAHFYILDYDHAIEYLRYTLVIGGCTFWAVYIDLIEVYKKTHQYDLAIQAYDVLLTNLYKPNNSIEPDPDMPQDIPEGTLRHNDWSRSFLYRQSSPTILYDLGHLLMELEHKKPPHTRDYNKSLLLFEAVLFIQPQYVLAYYDTARIYHQLQQYEQATEYLEYCLDTMPLNCDVYVLYIRVLCNMLERVKSIDSTRQFNVLRRRCEQLIICAYSVTHDQPTRLRSLHAVVDLFISICYNTKQAPAAKQRLLSHTRNVIVYPQDVLQHRGLLIDGNIYIDFKT